MEVVSLRNVFCSKVQDASKTVMDFSGQTTAQLEE